MTLYILGEKMGFVSQNGLDRFAFVPSCNQGKLLLTTTNDNFKTSNWIKTKPAAYSSDSYRHRTENADTYEWNTLKLFRV